MVETSGLSSDVMGAQPSGLPPTGPPPAGWSDAQALTTTTREDERPACVSPLVYFGDPPRDPAQCSACTCGAVTGASCAPPTVTCWDTYNCTGPSTDRTSKLAASGEACVINSVEGSCRLVGSPLATPGACAPSKVVKNAPTSTWRTKHSVCPSRPGDTRECTYRSGDLACPANWPDRIVAYGSFDDRRACSPCTCDAAQGATCTGGTYIFAAGFCLGVAEVLSTRCTEVEDYSHHRMAPAMVDATKASCKPAGGEPVGEWVGTDPVTICCRPR